MPIQELCVFLLQEHINMASHAPTQMPCSALPLSFVVFNQIDNFSVSYPIPSVSFPPTLVTLLYQILLFGVSTFNGVNTPLTILLSVWFILVTFLEMKSPTEQFKAFFCLCIILNCNHHLFRIHIVPVLSFQFPNPYAVH